VTEAAPALALEHIVKRFGNVSALVDASILVRRGSVHALLGENGAGKTTLMRVAYGMEQPDAGVVRVNGRSIRLASPADAIAAGVGMVHQHFTLVPAMTVAENVALGGSGLFHPTSANERAHAVGRLAGLPLDPGARVGDLSVSAQQRVELLKALSRDERILILDEPTAVLAPSEADDLLAQLRRLADSGRAIVLITHKLREALAVADAITVIRRGRTRTISPSEADEDHLVEAMLGRSEPRPPPTERTRIDGAPAIEARGVSLVDSRGVTRVRDATFSVRRGEVVGVAGVEGSGHRELLRALARRLRPSRGVLDLPPSVGFVPDDRHRDGLILGMTLVENLALNGAGSRQGRMRWRDLARLTDEAIREFDIRAAGGDVAAGVLSGGNQQKLILARELAGPPSALVVENPARGLDVRSAGDIERRLLLARNDGVAVVMYSTDIDELLAIADRMLVVFNGSVREVDPERGEVGRAMLGAVP
jgi:simple sugar transport system ATP-binding protein